MTDEEALKGAAKGQEPGHGTLSIICTTRLRQNGIITQRGHKCKQDEMSSLKWHHYPELAARLPVDEFGNMGTLKTTATSVTQLLDVHKLKCMKYDDTTGTALAHGYGNARYKH